MGSYYEQIAQWRQQRAQQQIANRVEQIKYEHAEAARERDQAIANNDLDTAEFRDDDSKQLEQEYNQYVPPASRVDPRLAEFARRNVGFLQRYGQKGYQALDAAHSYMMRPRNRATNDPRYTGMGFRPEHAFTPQYFERLKDLMEMHGETLFGVKFDRNEESLTATEAAKISGLSPQHYNYGVKMMHAAGRLGQKK
jgi:hypothetical protein